MAAKPLREQDFPARAGCRRASGAGLFAETPHSRRCDHSAVEERRFSLARRVHGVVPRKFSSEPLLPTAWGCFTKISLRPLLRTAWGCFANFLRAVLGDCMGCFAKKFAPRLWLAGMGGLFRKNLPTPLRL